MPRIRKPRLLCLPAGPEPAPDPAAPMVISIIERLRPVPLALHVMYVGSSYNPETIVTRVWRDSDEARLCERCSRCSARFLYHDGDGDGIIGTPVMCQIRYPGRIEGPDIPMLGYSEPIRMCEPPESFPRVLEA